MRARALVCCHAGVRVRFRPTHFNLSLGLGGANRGHSKHLIPTLTCVAKGMVWADSQTRIRTGRVASEHSNDPESGLVEH